MNQLFIFRLIQLTLVFALVGVFLNFFFSKERTSIRELEKHSSKSSLDAEVTVFIAKKVITMDPTKPFANAIAVKDGKVVYIGKVSGLLNFLNDNSYYLDDGFKNQVLMPGVVDAGSYLLLGSIANNDIFKEVYLQDSLRSEKDLRQIKSLPSAVKIYKTHESLEDNTDLEKPLIAYSNQSLKFVEGLLVSHELDRIFEGRAVLMWDSLNSKGYYSSAFKELLAEKTAQKEYKTEENIIESKLDFIKQMTLFYDKENFKRKLLHNINTLNKQGVTSALYTNFGAFDFNEEIDVLKEIYEKNDIPLRLVIRLASNLSNIKDLNKKENILQKLDIDKIYYKKSVDLFLEDKALVKGKQKQVSSYKEIKSILEPLWSNGYNIRLSIKASDINKEILFAIKSIKEKNYKADSKLIIGDLDHINYSYIRQLASFDVMLSINGASFNSLVGSSYETSRDFTTEIQALENYNIKYNLNTDILPSYYQPFSFIKLILRDKSNRATNQKLAEKGITSQDVTDALMLITHVPSELLSMDIELASIEKDKMADFIVLDKDPYNLKYGNFPSISVLSVVLGGKVYNNNVIQQVNNKLSKDL